MAASYKYYALIGLVHTLDNPFAVVRVGGEFDASFTTNLKWERTDLMYRIDSGRDNFDVVPISDEDAKRFEEVQARRVEAVRRRDQS